MTSEEKLSVLLADQQRRWKTDQPLSVEEYLASIPELAAETESMLQLIMGEFHARLAAGRSVQISELTTRFSDLKDVVQDRLAPYLVSDIDRTTEHSDNTRSVNGELTLAAMADGTTNRPTPH